MDLSPDKTGQDTDSCNKNTGKFRLAYTLWLHRVITADSYPDKTGQELIKIHGQKRDWRFTCSTDSCKKDTGNFRLAYTAVPVCRITPGDYGGFICRKNGTAAKITWQKRPDSCNKNTGNFRLVHTLL